MPTDAPKNSTSIKAEKNSKVELGRGSFFVSLGIFISRILGLVRDQVFAHYLGNSNAAGAFRAALRIPNFLQNLFGEGVLSASFIPTYTRLHASGDLESARQLAGAVASILALLTSILVLVGVWLTPLIVDLVAPGFENELRLLTIDLVRILFPGVGLLVMSAWCLGILNSHRRFFLSYFAPVFWNLALIATLVYFGIRNSSENDLVIYLAWGSVVGSFLQFAVQVPFVFQMAGKIAFNFSTRTKAVSEVFLNLGPVMISRGVVQISAYIDGIIASFLGATAVASLAYAQTIYLLPISLFGMAVAAAELPELSIQSTDSNQARLKMAERISAARRRIGFFVAPSAMAFLFLGRPIVEVIYQTGRFNAQDTLFVWYILIGSTVGLLAATWGRLYSSAFYALKDPQTPLKFACLRVGLTVLLGLLFAFPLRQLLLGFLHNQSANQLNSHPLLQIENTPLLILPTVPGIELGIGAIGLAFSSSLAGWLEFRLLKNSLEKRIGKTQILSGVMFKVWIAALASGIAVFVADLVFRERFAFSPNERRLISFLEIASFGGLYLLSAFILRLDEVRRIKRLLF